MRLWQRATKRGGVDPGRPHAFGETNDAGLGAAASASTLRSGSEMNALAVTTGFLRATRCAIPGCGKPREDPIHAPAEA